MADDQDWAGTPVGASLAQPGAADIAIPQASPQTVTAPVGGSSADWAGAPVGSSLTAQGAAFGDNAPPPNTEGQGWMANLGRFATGVENFGGRAMTGLQNTLLGGMQGTNPDPGRYKLAPDDQQWSVRETGHPLDQQKYMTLIDPADGQPKAFERNDTDNEGFPGGLNPAGLGRVLGTGFIGGGTEGAIGEMVGANPTALSQKVAQFDKAGVTPLAGDVSDSGFVKTLQNWLKNIPFAGGMVHAAATEGKAQAGAAADRIAGLYGDAENAQQGGAAIRQGIGKWLDQFGASSDKDYNSFFSSMPQDKTYDVSGTIAALKKPAAEFSGTAPGVASVITDNSLGRLGKAMEPTTTTTPPVFSKLLDENGDPILKQAGQTLQTGGQMTFPQMKAVRTWLGGQMKKAPMQPDMNYADYAEAYGALSDDMRKAAASVGPDALDKFDRANAGYSTGSNMVRNVLDPFMKGKSDEQLFNGVTAMANGRTGDINNLRQLMMAVPEEERGNFSSSLIRSMGKASPGAQESAEGASFSPSTFFTNYAKMSPQAKNVLFGTNDPSLKPALDKIADALNIEPTGNMIGNRGQLENLANVTGMQKSTERLANTSHSATHGTVGGILIGGLTAMIEGGEASIPHIMTGAAAAYGMGRAFTSPNFLKAMSSLTGARSFPQAARMVSKIDTYKQADPNNGAAYDWMKAQANNIIDQQSANLPPITRAAIQMQRNGANPP